MLDCAVERFRPNLLIEPAAPGLGGFVEERWQGGTLAIGKQLIRRVEGGCSRSVITTLPQDSCLRSWRSCLSPPATTGSPPASASASSSPERWRWGIRCAGRPLRLRPVTGCEGRLALLVAAGKRLGLAG